MATAIAESEEGPAPPHAHEKSPGAQAISLDLPSCVQMVKAVDQFVAEVATSAGFDQDSALDIQIAVHDAVLNAVVHGNGQDESRRVRLEVVPSVGALGVLVEDEGLGFDPGDVPDPLSSQNVCKGHGRGILFMRSLMDEVRFRRSPEGRTQVWMLKRRSRSGQPTGRAIAASSLA